MSTLLVGITEAQITITKEYYTSLFGKTVNYTTYQLPVQSFELESIVKTTLSGGVANFHALEATATPSKNWSVRYHRGSDSNPFDDQHVFANSDMFTVTFGAMYGDTLKYTFYTFSGDSLNIIGYAETAEYGYYLNMNQFDEPVLTQKLPLSHEDSWIVSKPWEIPNWAGKTRANDVVDELPPFRYEKNVDSWGSMRLAMGITVDMIRVSTVKIYDILYNPIMGYAYKYLSLDGHYVNIETTNAGVITKAVVGMAKIVGDVNTSNPNDRSDLPEGFALEQNYPNPFNPSTTISYSIPFNADVTLSVIDLTGRVVSQMQMPRQSAGAHKVALDASHLSSGVYLYRIQAGGYAASRKFTLIK